MNEEEAKNREKSVDCFEIVGDRDKLGPKEETTQPTNGNSEEPNATKKG